MPQGKFTFKSPVSKRRGHGEGIRQMPDFKDLAVGQQDFNDVETYFDGGIFQKAQIVQAAPGKAAAAFRVDSSRGTGPFLGGTGFDFGKHEAITVAKNQINLTAIRPEIGGEKFQPLLLEIFFGRALAEEAATQMFRLRFPGELCFEFFNDVHRRGLNIE
jgi:hypothetical protein